MIVSSSEDPIEFSQGQSDIIAAADERVKKGRERVRSEKWEWKKLQWRRLGESESRVN